MGRIEIKSNATGQHHAQIIRKNVRAAAGFVKNHAATGAVHAEFALGTITGYATGFLRGLFSGAKPEGNTSPNPF